MPTVSETTELAARPEAVWEHLAHPAGYGEWMTVHSGIAGEAPELAEGAKFTQRLTIMGMPGEVNWTVTEFDPPNRLRMSGEGPMGVKAETTYELSAAGEGTSLRYETGFEGDAIAAMAGPLEASSKQAAADSMAKFRELVG